MNTPLHKIIGRRKRISRLTQNFTKEDILEVLEHTVKWLYDHLGTEGKAIHEHPFETELIEELAHKYNDKTALAIFNSAYSYLQGEDLLEAAYDCKYRFTSELSEEDIKEISESIHQEKSVYLVSNYLASGKNENL